MCWSLTIALLALHLRPPCEYANSQAFLDMTLDMTRWIAAVVTERDELFAGELRLALLAKRANPFVMILTLHQNALCQSLEHPPG